jgi:uncharacterized protein (DUF924 family)
VKPLLKIRDAQMSALTDVVVTSWLRTEIEALFPAKSAVMGAQALERFVTAGTERARRYGFTSRDYLSFLSLEMTFGEDFMRENWARQALEGEPDTAMQRLRHEAIFLLAKQAEDAERQEEADRAVPPPDDEPPIERDTPVEAVGVFAEDAGVSPEEGQ